MSKKIVNVSDLDWQSSEHGNFAYQLKRLGSAANYLH